MRQSGGFEVQNGAYLCSIMNIWVSQSTSHRMLGAALIYRGQLACVMLKAIIL